MPHTVLRTVLHDPAAHWPAYLAALAVAVGSFWISWGLVVLAVFVVLVLEISRRSESLVFYDDGVARVFQLVSRNKSFLEYDDIQEFTVTQSLVERMLNLGTIHMQTAGENAADISFDGIRNPDAIEQLMHDCLGSVNRNVRSKDVKEDVAAPTATENPPSTPATPATG